MLFHVEMRVQLPPSLTPVEVQELQRRERELCQDLQRTGQWRHLWRVVGRYANVSIFDVASPGELHDLLTKLPLFPYMEIDVRALCRHPSSIADDER